MHTAGVPRVSFVCVTTVKRAAPIFPVQDLRASLDHYQRLGFATREYPGGGTDTRSVMASRSTSECRQTSSRQDPGHSAYLVVDDADELAEAWRAAGIEVHMPENTEWGQHEGAHVDPDGNVLRFGSPML
jgi:uncharacterized glyoxalase superfamily protein PhnB